LKPIRAMIKQEAAHFHTSSVLYRNERGRDRFIFHQLSNVIHPIVQNHLTNFRLGRLAYHAFSGTNERVFRKMEPAFNASKTQRTVTFGHFGFKYQLLTIFK
jgi:hypothetical protein